MAIAAASLRDFFKSIVCRGPVANSVAARQRVGVDNDCGANDAGGPSRAVRVTAGSARTRIITRCHCV